MQYPQWLNNFVNNVSSDLGDRPDYSSQYLMSWFLDPSNLGLLNNQIGRCYNLTGYYSQAGKLTGVGIVPELYGDELSIYKANFDVFFYGREAKMALSGSYGAGAWTSLREGDSAVTRINRSELARTYQMFKKDAQDTVNHLIKQYLRSKSSAQTVDGNDTLQGGYYLVDRGFWYPRSEPGL